MWQALLYQNVVDVRWGDATDPGAHAGLARAQRPEHGGKQLNRVEPYQAEGCRDGYLPTLGEQYSQPYWCCNKNSPIMFI